MSATSLINREFAASTLTGDDHWCTSHGAETGTERLGAGLIYYALAYSFRAKICVCLGSGGGFVPRLMRQAQRDLGIAGSRTILVDGAGKVTADERRIWGTPSWIAEDSAFRRDYPEIEILRELTEDAFRNRFAPQGLSIDYLHIDADHHYEGVKKDWDLYHTLVPAEGVISLHDTVNYREPCGVPALIDEIREDPAFELVNFPIAYGTAVVKRRQLRTRAHSRKTGT